MCAQQIPQPSVCMGLMHARTVRLPHTRNESESNLWCLWQVIHLEEGDVEGEDATEFFGALGASDPKSVTIATA